MTALSVYLTCSHVGGWATYSLNALMQQTYLNVLATRLLTQKLYQFCLSHQFEISTPLPILDSIYLLKFCQSDSEMAAHFNFHCLNFGRRSLVGCSPWGCYESDRTERLHFPFSLSCVGEGNGNPLQCSCLENPRDSGAWWAAIYGVSQSDTTEAT